MTKAWEQSSLKATELVLLLALADAANDEGYCWPTMPTLEKKSRLKERTVQYLLTKLEQVGDITILERGTGRKSSRYRVHPGAANSAPLSTTRDAQSTPLNAAVCTPGVQKDPTVKEQSANAEEVPNPSSEPSLDPRKKSVGSDTELLAAIGRIHTHFTEAILPTAKNTPISLAAIRRRLEAHTFTEAELLTAIDNFAADGFCMHENGGRGISWWFADENRIEAWLNLTPDPLSHLPRRQREQQATQHKALVEIQTAYDPDHYLKGELGHRFKTHADTAPEPPSQEELAHAANDNSPFAQTLRRAYSQ